MFFKGYGMEEHTCVEVVCVIFDEGDLYIRGLDRHRFLRVPPWISRVTR